LETGNWENESDFEFRPDFIKLANSEIKRIGLFGGTFNPIHFGHLRAAKEAEEEFDLDRVYLIPSAFPPHKSSEDIADPEDRLEMIRMAISDCPELMVSDVELMRSGISYTIDTIHYFKSVLPEDTELFFIVGIDAFLEIDLWKFHKELFDMVPFIVMARPGVRGTSPAYLRTRWKSLENFIQTRISGGYAFSDAQTCYVHPEKKTISLFDVTLLDISATKIRKRIREGMSVRFMLPREVEHFIRKKGLFV